MANAIDHLLGQTKILKTNAPASVHVCLNKSNSGPATYQLSLVNTSSSSQRPFRDLIPVESINVELPFMIESVEILYNSDKGKVKYKNNILTIDRLEEFYSAKITSK
jgi:hypothetical protein